MNRILLSMQEVTAFYGSSQALFGMNLELERGELVALLGRNGMGKTTAMRAICRMTPHRGGKIVVDGVEISRMSSHTVARLGLGLAPEGRRCFSTLTVEENLLSAARNGYWDLKRVFALFPQIRDRRSQIARTLSGGEQQMLAIGRALMTNPRLLLLDEATEGLAPLVRREIWRAISELKKSDLAILLVDRSLKEISRIADRCVILERGRDVWMGSPEQLTRSLAERHLGV